MTIDDDNEIVAYPLSYNDSLPVLKPASRVRDWQLQTTDSFAVRCLPLNIANNNGWELVLPGGFDAVYHGRGNQISEVEIFPHGDGPCIASSHFGFGVLTFDVQYLFRTPDGVNLQIQGPMNLVKDGIQALCGILETDWSPYSTTMNWKFTRPCRIRFCKGDSFAQLSPIPASYVNSFSARVGKLEVELPELHVDFKNWAKSRSEFLQKLNNGDPETVKVGWQKLYYRGFYPDGERKHCEHATRLHPAPFEPFPDAEAASGLLPVRVGNYPVTCAVRVDSIDWRLYRLLDELSSKASQIILFFKEGVIDKNELERTVKYVNVEFLPIVGGEGAEEAINQKARYNTILMLEPKHMLLKVFWENFRDYESLLDLKYRSISLNVFRSKYAYPSRATLEEGLNQEDSIIEPLNLLTQVLIRKEKGGFANESGVFVGNDRLIIT